jgi:hypothetical protein
MWRCGAPSAVYLVPQDESDTQPLLCVLEMSFLSKVEHEGGDALARHQHLSLFLLDKLSCGTGRRSCPWDRTARRRLARSKPLGGRRCPLGERGLETLLTRVEATESCSAETSEGLAIVVGGKTLAEVVPSVPLVKVLQRSGGGGEWCVVSGRSRGGASCVVVVVLSGGGEWWWWWWSVGEVITGGGGGAHLLVGGAGCGGDGHACEIRLTVFESSRTPEGSAA